jgi:hypothetical protein
MCLSTVEPAGAQKPASRSFLVSLDIIDIEDNASGLASLHQTLSTAPSLSETSRTLPELEPDLPHRNFLPAT